MKISTCLSCLFIFGINASRDFLIDTSSCKMPLFDHFSEEANRTYMYLPPIKCSEFDSLTHVTVENNTAHLRIRKKYLNQYYESDEEIDCCYSYIMRAGTPDEPDVGISWTECHSFNSTVTLQEDTVMVKCYLGADKIYENVHKSILISPDIYSKLKYSHKKQRRTKRKPLSVILMVIDSVSRLNFQRTMPQTRNYLLGNDFVEFFGYNKIDDNTFPNFNAILTGLNLNQSNAICKPNLVGYLDKCPMIWYDYRDQGYVTAYAEDWAQISTYNYLKKGFKEPPTDYYFKPYLEAAEDLLSVLTVDTMPFCAGHESEGERVLKLAQDFTKTFRYHPYFGIFWMNTFSHNHINTPSRMDHTMKNFFENIKRNGILNESMVIVLSDHGIRFGEVRHTVQGWYEERLPANFISLPNWFQKAHPEKYENLKRNAHKLTSTYDLYMTLQEVLALSMNSHVAVGSKACPSCQSLFSNIPYSRGCRQAGIPEVWCTCLGKFNENDSEITVEVNNRAFRFLRESGRLKPGVLINKLLSSSVSRSPDGKSYFLINFETVQSNYLAGYQGLFEISLNPVVEFLSLLSFTRLY
ncbi:unnamed protein product [Phaedon cochleariae]|uniref:DUF229 domain containing protein n=1 Tax=Phaedon cochleariae TaxID=80249 RepID=A0A9N9SG61_PHACE|nr:unnamed protein product [Phaedon cochleariae]